MPGFGGFLRPGLTSPRSSGQGFPMQHAAKRKRADIVAFDRQELGMIMSVYGRMVAAGEWRDYALSFLGDVAICSVFRRAAETPVYRIEKRPALRNAQGM